MTLFEIFNFIVWSYAGYKFGAEHEYILFKKKLHKQLLDMIFCMKKMTDEIDSLKESAKKAGEQ